MPLIFPTANNTYRNINIFVRLNIFYLTKKKLKKPTISKHNIKSETKNQKKKKNKTKPHYQFQNIKSEMALSKWLTGHCQNNFFLQTKY